ncbi:hypothetical protein [Persephonella sp.]
MKKIGDLQLFVKDVVSKEYPSFKKGYVTVYQLGKDHLLLELFDRDENKAGEIILNLKAEKLYKDGRGYSVRIEGTPKGMVRYYLQEGNKKLEGKAEGLYPCLTL